LSQLYFSQEWRQENVFDEMGCTMTKQANLIVHDLLHFKIVMQEANCRSHD
jgi:hypothetical protein